MWRRWTVVAPRSKAEEVQSRKSFVMGKSFQAMRGKSFQASPRRCFSIFVPALPTLSVSRPG